jgi:hypothetical protein
MELIDGIRVFRLDNNEEEVLWEVGRLKLGEWLTDELITSIENKKISKINWHKLLTELI